MDNCFTVDEKMTDDCVTKAQAFEEQLQVAHQAASGKFNAVSEEWEADYWDCLDAVYKLVEMWEDLGWR